jgi:hypothetical protein
MLGREAKTRGAEGVSRHCRTALEAEGSRGVAKDGGCVLAGQIWYPCFQALQSRLQLMLPGRIRRRDNGRSNSLIDERDSLSKALKNLRSVTEVRTTSNFEVDRLALLGWEKIGPVHLLNDNLEEVQNMFRSCACARELRGCRHDPVGPTRGLLGHKPQSERR